MNRTQITHFAYRY